MSVNARFSGYNCFADFDLISSIDYNIINIQYIIYNIKRLVNILKILKNLDTDYQFLIKISYCEQLYFFANNDNIKIE